MVLGGWILDLWAADMNNDLQQGCSDVELATLRNTELRNRTQKK